MKIHFSVLADLGFEPYLLVEVMQRRETETALAMQEDLAGGDLPESELPNANDDSWCLCSSCPTRSTEAESFNFSLGAVANTYPKSLCALVCMKVLVLTWTEGCWRPPRSQRYTGKDNQDQQGLEDR